MLWIALAFAAVSSAALVALLARRRRAPAAGLLTPIGPLPPGVRHLAARVSDLSALRVELPVARRAVEPRRLGALLGLR
jgi:hypothetical protein